MSERLDVATQEKLWGIFRTALNEAQRYVTTASDPTAQLDTLASRLVEQVSDALNPSGVEPLDFPDRTPAEIVCGNYPSQPWGPTADGTTRGYVRLTGPQINALCEAAGLTGNWGKPRPLTWISLRGMGLMNPGFSVPTDKGRDWLKAAGLLK